MANAKKATEYKVANYDGRFKAIPEAGLAGNVEVKPDGVWDLHLGFRKNIWGRFDHMPFEVVPLSGESCRVTVRSVDNPNFGVKFDLPGTPASVLEADLAERGLLLDQMMAAAAKRGQRKASGQWWVGIRPYRIFISCHYSGARNKGESGSLEATVEGLHYKAALGSKVSIPWQAIHDIETSMQSTSVTGVTP